VRRRLDQMGPLRRHAPAQHRQWWVCALGELRWASTPVVVSAVLTFLLFLNEEKAMSYSTVDPRMARNPFPGIHCP
jgi:hypothetical protein